MPQPSLPLPFSFLPSITPRVVPSLLPNDLFPLVCELALKNCRPVTHENRTPWPACLCKKSQQKLKKKVEVMKPTLLNC